MGHPKQLEQQARSGESYPLVASGAKVTIMLLLILILVDIIFLPASDGTGPPVSRSWLGDVAHLLLDPLYLFKKSLISVFGGLLYVVVLRQRKLAK